MIVSLNKINSSIPPFKENIPVSLLHLLIARLPRLVRVVRVPLQIGSGRVCRGGLNVVFVHSGGHEVVAVAHSHQRFPWHFPLVGRGNKGLRRLRDHRLSVDCILRVHLPRVSKWRRHLVSENTHNVAFRVFGQKFG